jgi:hypothetical protein
VKVSQGLSPFSSLEPIDRAFLALIHPAMPLALDAMVSTERIIRSFRRSVSREDAREGSGVLVPALD